MTKQKKKDPSRLRTTLKILLILATSILICVTTYGIYLTKKAESAANRAFEEIGNRENSEKRSEKVIPIEDNISILFIGVDDSEKRGKGSDNALSDALILATMNVKTKTVKTLSIPRDSYVFIPSTGRNDKITHAHARGGTLSTIDTVENLLDIPVDYYVRLNFNAFIDVVDALGGIEVDVPYTFTEQDENDNPIITLEKGFQKLNGSEALALARTRKKDSDIYRGKRQQEILKAIAVEVAKPSSLLKYDDIIDAVADNMKTNLSFIEMRSFLTYIAKGMPRIDSLYLDGSDDTSTGIYYYKLNEAQLNETKAILKNHLELDGSTSTGSNVNNQSSTELQNESNNN